MWAERCTGQPAWDGCLSATLHHGGSGPSKLRSSGASVCRPAALTGSALVCDAAFLTTRVLLQVKACLASVQDSACHSVQLGLHHCSSSTSCWLCVLQMCLQVLIQCLKPKLLA